MANESIPTQMEIQLETSTLGTGDEDEQNRQKFIQPIKLFPFKRNAQFGPTPKRVYAYCFKDLHLFYLLMLPRKRLRM